MRLMMGNVKEKYNESDLRHSAHESRVAPRLRFLAGSGVGEGSRLLGDGEDMGRRMTKDQGKLMGFITPRDSCLRIATLVPRHKS